MATNYIEYVICDSPVKDDRVIEISQDNFERYMMNLKGKNSFQVDTKEYIFENMHLIKKIKDTQVEETKVYDFKFIEHKDYTHYRELRFNRSKIAVTAFPSTNNIHMILHKRRQIYRINNRIYVNFEFCWYKNSQDMHRKVYINYNRTQDADIDKDTADIHALIELIKGIHF